MLTVSRLFLAATLTLCAAVPAPALADDAPDGNDLSLRTCAQLDIARSTAMQEGKMPEWSPLDFTCTRYVMAQNKLPRDKIPLVNLSTDTRAAQCLQAFFAIAPDGTQYETEYEGEGCAARLKCKVELTLSATDGNREQSHEEYAHRMTRLVSHDSGRWLALQRGQFACHAEAD